MEKSNKEEIKEELKRISAIDAMIKSNGGKIVMKGLKSDIVAVINDLMNNYKMASHSELIALAARLKERYELYNSFRGIPESKRIVEEDLEDLNELTDPE
jgi:hypothetical protein